VYADARVEDPNTEDMSMSNDVEKEPKSRGFASMDPSKQKEIASRGGKAAHAQGRAHEFTADEARAAGRKGGQAVSRDRNHMAMIGRQGGKRRGQNLRAQRELATPETTDTPAE
jgi:general stress protein YciG